VTTTVLIVATMGILATRLKKRLRFAWSQPASS